MNKFEKQRTAELVADNVRGLLAEHGERFMASYEKTDKTFAISLRVSLKEVEGMVSCKATINYADEKISDYSQCKINPDQGELFDDEGEANGAMAGEHAAA